MIKQQFSWPLDYKPANHRLNLPIITEEIRKYNRGISDDSKPLVPVIRLGCILIRTARRYLPLPELIDTSILPFWNWLVCNGDDYNKEKYLLDTLADEAYSDHRLKFDCSGLQDSEFLSQDMSFTGIIRNGYFFTTHVPASVLPDTKKNSNVMVLFPESQIYNASSVKSRVTKL